MQKITKDEFDSFTNKGINTLGDFVRELNIGEGVIIKRDEWKLKSEPSVLLGQYSKRYSKKFISKRLIDNTGWGVLRVS